MNSILVAMSRNNVIGKSNDLPWYLPADLKRFKELTTGHTVIMGRKTYDSIVARLHSPLPNRTNVVVTRDHSFKAPGCTVVNSVEVALQDQPEEVFVIGGAQIYEQALSQVDRLYITEIDADIDGDTYFPPIDMNTWEETSREIHHADERNTYDYSFVTYTRKHG